MFGWISRFGALFGRRVPSRLHACLRNETGVPPVPPACETVPHAEAPAAEPLYPPEVYGFRGGSD